jgi:hypothetical protein
MPPDPTLVSAAQAAAAQYGIPWDLFQAQIMQESGFNPNPPSNPAWPQSSGGPSGIAQFIPGTAAQYNVNPLDPIQSLYGAAHYDADLYKAKGSWASVMQSYGTVPSSGALTPTQQNVLDLATNADQSGTSAMTAPVPGGPAAPAPGTTAGSTAPGQTASGPSLFGNILVRVLLGILGIAFIVAGIWMLHGGTKIDVVVENVAGKAKGLA